MKIYKRGDKEEIQFLIPYAELMELIDTLYKLGNNRKHEHPLSDADILRILGNKMESEPKLSLQGASNE